MNLDIRNIPKKYESLINKIKEDLNILTTSKIFYYLLENYKETQEEIESLKNKINDQRLKIDELEDEAEDYKLYFQLQKKLIKND